MLHCSGEKITRIDCADATVDELTAFLSDSNRIMRALLDPKNLRQLGPDRFLYASRPYRLLTFQIQPQVVFAVGWEAEKLHIVFESCDIAGLGDIEKSLCFTCKASIHPVNGGLEAVATADLKLTKTALTAFIPDPVWLGLGRKALNLVFKRLEERCQRRLRKSAVRWVQRASSLA